MQLNGRMRVPFDSNRPTVNPWVDRNTVEFIGYMVLDKTGNYDPNGKNFQ